MIMLLCISMTRITRRIVDNFYGYRNYCYRRADGTIGLDAVSDVLRELSVYLFVVRVCASRVGRCVGIVPVGCVSCQMI